MNNRSSSGNKSNRSSKTGEPEKANFFIKILPYMKIAINDSKKSLSMLAYAKIFKYQNLNANTSIFNYFSINVLSEEDHQIEFLKDMLALYDKKNFLLENSIKDFQKIVLRKEEESSRNKVSEIDTKLWELEKNKLKQENYKLYCEYEKLSLEKTNNDKFVTQFSYISKKIKNNCIKLQKKHTNKHLELVKGPENSPNTKTSSNLKILEELNDIFDNLQHSLNDAKLQNEKLHTEITKLEKEIGDSNNLAKELSIKNEGIKENELQLQLSAREKYNEDLLEKTNDLNSQLEQDLAEKEKEIKKITDLLNDYKNKEVKLKEDNKNFEVLLEKAKAQYRKLETDLIEKDKQLIKVNESVNFYKSNETSNKEKDKNTENTLDNLKNINNKLEVDLQYKEKEIIKLTEQIESYKIDLNELQNKEKQLEIIKEKEKSNIIMLEKAKTNLSNLSNESEKYLSSNKEKEEMIKNITIQLDDLKNKETLSKEKEIYSSHLLESSKALNTKLENQLEEKSQQLYKLNILVNELQNKENISKDKLDGNYENTQKLKDQLLQLQNKLTSIEEKYNQETDKKKKYKEKLNVSINELTELKKVVEFKRILVRESFHIELIGEVISNLRSLRVKEHQYNLEFIRERIRVKESQISFELIGINIERKASSSLDIRDNQKELSSSSFSRTEITPSKTTKTNSVKRLLHLSKSETGKQIPSITGISGIENYNEAMNGSEDCFSFVDKIISEQEKVKQSIINCINNTKKHFDTLHQNVNSNPDSYRDKETGRAKTESGLNDTINQTSYLEKGFTSQENSFEIQDKDLQLKTDVIIFILLI